MTHRPSPEPLVVLITGATGGLGRGAARAFAGDGARLGLVGTDASRLAAVAAEIGAADDAWVPAVADLRDAAGAAAAIATVEARFGRIDVVLHLVGGWTGGTALAELDPAVLGSMLDQHVWSTFHVTRAAVPGMTTRGWGRIIAITSSLTANPGPRASAYLAAKSGQEALLRVLAREVAADGVTVNLIAVRAIEAADAQPADRDTTAKRSGTTTDEIVAVMRFLVSDEATAVTGQRIALDGRG